MYKKKNNETNNIIIFGSSRGIGMQIASNLLKNNYNILISSGNKLNLENAFKKLKKQDSHKNNLQSFLLDFEDHNSIFKNLLPILKLNQVFSVLIFSSAVLGPSGCFSDIAITDWKKTFNVNVFGPATIIQFFLKYNYLVAFLVLIHSSILLARLNMHLMVSFTHFLMNLQTKKSGVILFYLEVITQK